MQADDAPPILRLEIESDKPLLARDVGRLMERLGFAHQAFQIALGTPPDERETLRIRKVWTGSYVAEFILVGAAAFVVIDEARERLIAFVRRLIRAARVLAGADQDDRAGKAETDVIDAARILVKKGFAIRVDIYVHGDNKNRLEIDAEAVQEMEDFRQLTAAARAIGAKQAGKRRHFAEDEEAPAAGVSASGRIPEIRFTSARGRGDWIVFETRAPWSSKIITVRVPTFLADRLFENKAAADGEAGSREAAALVNRDAIDRAFKRAWARGEFEPDIDAPDDHFFVGLQASDFQ
jgi:hypothetical protein